MALFGKLMFKIIFLQIVLLCVAVLISGILVDVNGAWSALLGGLCYLLPSALAALILNIFRSRPQYAGYAFIFGEGLRIVLALILLVSVFALHGSQIHFLSFLSGLLLVSHVFFIYFWKVKPYGK